MSMDTIDAILEAFSALGYPVKLSELACLLERHMHREKLVELLEGAQFSKRDRDVMDMVLDFVRDELREQPRQRRRAGNPNVVHAFDPSPIAPTVLKTPAAND